MVVFILATISSNPYTHTSSGSVAVTSLPSITARRVALIMSGNPLDRATQQNRKHPPRRPGTPPDHRMDHPALTPQPRTTARITTQEPMGAQQERLIAALLSLANSQRGLEQLESLDLADITQQVLDTRQHEAERHGIRLSADLAAAPATG